MRYTVNRCGKWIIPKNQLSEAAEKLAEFEDAEELDEVEEYCRAMRCLAYTVRKNGRSEYADALETAAAKIIQLNTFHTTASGAMAEKTQKAASQGERMKQEIFKFLDEIDGLMLDDPIFVIREKLEEILGGCKE